MPDILRKADREQCWSSRDSYWDCVRGLMKDSDSNMPEKALIQKNCNNYRKQYEADCPDTWIRLFDQKQSFELFKSKKFEEDLKLSVRKGEK
ncbi:hypothetical protein D915_009648 [Fasciola hepatica]|uniref:Cytochrome c oxidase assembly factor 6 homolog n=1 Tax=Fasciola hepatica TaxID=6192 RepID=A0A4E0R0G6_FASHE|nr:hypothetical protein D915_009648 [Fasciola hepatica]